MPRLSKNILGEECAPIAEPKGREGQHPLPAGWRWVRLGEVCRIISGSTPSSSVPDFWNGDLMWITPTDLGSNDSMSINTCARHISKAGYDSCGTEFVPAGAVVMSSRAPIGHLGIAGVPLCTNQGCKSFVPKEGIDSFFLYHALKKCVPELQELGSGATFKEVSKTALELFCIPLPPFSEQKRIAAILNDQMAVLKKARDAVAVQLKAAEAIASSYLRKYFDSAAARGWPLRSFGDVVDLLPAKSISSDGDTEVMAITTACLTEEGFNPLGIKSARMSAKDAVASGVSRGEVLVARSNTPELVGRVAMYDGVPPTVVASDLTIRLFPRQELLSSFLVSCLSYLYLMGYWEERAGGASGTMKKITRTQLLEEKIPVPSLVEQRRIVGQLSDRIDSCAAIRRTVKENLVAIDALPAALLRRAFNGEL